ncbi:hypothetical protein LF1_21990 [Rubripirellula obstinata]|uniref:Uncharacterized protein n=1 Tax=Rubripirellula obstinata TaxID=406547 RepID=A0A5B1CK14_9BACT|nr:hypothetical protein [Rubripirellula obstinata]KAA1259664.1 hypothetical protein LF1_21990 [Rubripirellula obstinata]
MSDLSQPNRREFIATSAAAGLAIPASATATDTTELSDSSMKPAATSTSAESLACQLFQMLNDRQQRDASLSMAPKEHEIQFRGQQSIPGLPVTDMTPDQKEYLQAVLVTLVEMYRPTDQTDAVACLANQGGLDACFLSFFRDEDIGCDKVWDNWRLEGPSFVWHYRGAPHVDVWVNIANDAGVKTNSHLVG